MNKNAEKFHWFKIRILQDAELLGVTSENNVAHQIDLLVEAVERAIFNIENEQDPEFVKKSNQKEREKYIAIFKQSYKLLTEVEYIQVIAPKDAKLIDNIIKKITEEGTSSEDYLKYLFEEYFPSNPKMTPSFAFTISTFALQQFLVNKKEMIKSRKEAIKKNMEISDLLNRQRVLFRQTKDSTLVEALKQYRNGNITLNDFKEIIIHTEEKVKKMTNQTDTISMETTDALSIEDNAFTEQG